MTLHSVSYQYQFSTDTRQICNAASSSADGREQRRKNCKLKALLLDIQSSFNYSYQCTIAVLMSTFLIFRSSFTLSIQVFLAQPGQPCKPYFLDSADYCFRLLRFITDSFFYTFCSLESADFK